MTDDQTYYAAKHAEIQAELESKPGHRGLKLFEGAYAAYAAGDPIDFDSDAPLACPLRKDDDGPCEACQ